MTRQLLRTFAVAAGVATAVVVLPADAGANTAVRHAEITSVEPVAGYQVVYEGAAVRVTPGPSGTLAAQCAFQVIPSTTLPELIWDDCWFEYVDTGAVFRLLTTGAGWAYSAGGADLTATDDRQLRFCIRVVVGGSVTTRGPTRCDLL